MKKRILVTGSAGVIGKPLMDMLIKEDNEILSFDLMPLNKEGITHIQCDLSEEIPHIIKEFKPEIIFHLAAKFERTKESANFWKESFKHNVLLSHNLVQAISKLHIDKFIFASSYLVYDSELYLDKAYPHYLEEGDKIQPRNMVGAAKYFTEQELMAVTDVINARIFRVYGNGSKDVISRWIRNDKSLGFYGEDNAFDYIYANDVAEGLLRLSKTNYHGAVNLGYGSRKSIGQIIKILESRINKPFKKIGNPDDHQLEQSIADMNLFNLITNWMPQISLEDGIDRIIKYEESKKA
jgi:nucleoside-diphosphate-sugar epimerase